MKLKATTKQIQCTKFSLNFILLTTFQHMACIQTHPTRDFVLKSFDAGRVEALRLYESKL